MPKIQARSNRLTRIELLAAVRALSLAVLLLDSFVAFGGPKDAKQAARKSPDPAAAAHAAPDCKHPDDHLSQATVDASAQADSVASKERIGASHSMKLKSSSSETAEPQSAAQECERKIDSTENKTRCKSEKIASGHLQCERSSALEQDLVLPAPLNEDPQE